MAPEAKRRLEDDRLEQRSQVPIEKLIEYASSERRKCDVCNALYTEVQNIGFWKCYENVQLPPPSDADLLAAGIDITDPNIYQSCKRRDTAMTRYRADHRSHGEPWKQGDNDFVFPLQVADALIQSGMLPRRGSPCFVWNVPGYNIGMEEVMANYAKRSPARALDSKNHFAYPVQGGLDPFGDAPRTDDRWMSSLKTSEASKNGQGPMFNCEEPQLFVRRTSAPL